jgi:hypothetical protein
MLRGGWSETAGGNRWRRRYVPVQERALSFSQRFFTKRLKSLRLLFHAQAVPVNIVCRQLAHDTQRRAAALAVGVRVRAHGVYLRAVVRTVAVVCVPGVACDKRQAVAV